MVKPEVSAPPQLGRGTQQTFAAFESIFSSANQYIRPAVEQQRKAAGEQEALAELEKKGPEWGLKQLEGKSQVIGETKPRRGVRPTRAAGAVVQGLMDRGLPQHVAMGFAINFQDESGFDPTINERNPTVPGSRGGFGLAQWTGPRRRDLEAFAESSGRDVGDLDTQLDFLMAENQGSEAGAFSKIMQAKDANEAAVLVLNEWLRPAEENRARREAEYLGGAGLSIPATPEYELQTLNANTFEPRVPFTVKDAAFNAAADRVIATKAAAAMDQGMRAAQTRANGDLGVLRDEMEKVRAQVMAELPKELPGLATEIQAQFDRGRVVAERQAVDLAQRRVYQQQEQALAQAVTLTQQEAERMALTGATETELADLMAQATDGLSRFGPREEFEIAGRVYPADPSRAGVLTPAAIADSMTKVSLGARRLMIEADFERSAAPGQYVDEFRRNMYAGNSPLPPGESLELLRSMESRARSNESARRTAAAAERKRLEQGMTDTINAYVSMGEAGVPVAIPPEERARITASLSAYPDLQRQAQIEFAVADAQVATHGMTGSELTAFVGSVRGDMRAAAERGELDLGGAAIIASLEDRIKKVQDAVTAETLGLPLIEQLAMDGATADAVNYDALREQAAGKPELLQAISEVETFHRDVEMLDHMTAQERAMVLEDARGALATLAAKGNGLGTEALTTQAVVDKLEAWSAHRQELASKDPVKFAQSVGVELPSFAEAVTIADVGAVIGQRVAILAPHTSAEGVDNPVPLTQSELDAISETFEQSGRGQRAEFLGTVADLGEDQAMAVFKRIGEAEPVIYAAGSVYTMGNKQAAGVILRGAVDTKLDGGSATDIASARENALGPLLEADVLDPEGIKALDDTALAYARGLAMAERGRAIEQDDIEAGYAIALGQQEDGSGGFAETRYGPTLLPSGWTSGRVNRSLRAMTDEQLTAFAGGMVTDAFGRTLTADQVESNIEGLRPTDDPMILIPVDAEGRVFATDNGAERGILRIDLREFE